jgi:hypothetical protein
MKSLSDAIQHRKKSKIFHQRSEELVSNSFIRLIFVQEKNKMEISPPENPKTTITTPVHIATRLPTEKKPHFGKLLETVEKYGMFRNGVVGGAPLSPTIGCMPYSHGSALSFNAYIHQILNAHINFNPENPKKTSPPTSLSSSSSSTQQKLSPLDITFGNSEEKEVPTMTPTVYGLMNRRLRFHGQGGKIFCAIHIYPKTSFTEFEALIRVGKSPDNGNNGDTVKINIGNCSEGLAFVEQLKHSFEKEVGMLVYDSTVQPNLPPLPPAPAMPLPHSTIPLNTPNLPPNTSQPTPVPSSIPIPNPSIPNGPVPPMAPTSLLPVAPSQPNYPSVPMATSITNGTAEGPSSIPQNIALPPSMHGLLKKEFGPNANITINTMQVCPLFIFFSLLFFRKQQRYLYPQKRWE